MAIVSRIATLKFSATTGGDTAGFRQWQATATQQDYPAGALISITIVQTSGGLSAPGAADTLTISLRSNDGVGVIQSFVLDAAAASQVYIVRLTANGSFGSGDRSGTFFIDLRVTKTTGGPTATYDYETDGAPATPPSLNTAATVNRGFVRGTTSVAQVLSNVALGGGDITPYQYLDTLYLRSTLAAQLNTAANCTSSIRDAGAGTVRRSLAASNAVQFDVVFSGTSTSGGRVNSGFPASSSAYETHFALPNNALTGVAETTVTITRDTATIDPRLTVAHLLQIDNNTYGIPPFSDPNISTQRVFPSNGYIATNLRGARGEFAFPNLSGGLNAISFNIGFVADATGQDFGSVGRVTATRGGEDGWQDTLLIWTAVVGGTWTKTVSLTMPDLSDAYLIGASIQYALIATNPNIFCVIRAAPQLNPGRHFTPGDDVEVRINLFDAGEYKITSADAAPMVIVKRLNRSTLIEEYAYPDPENPSTKVLWAPMLMGGIEQAAYAWGTLPGSTYVAGGSPNLYFLRFSATQTADFDLTDLVIIGIALKLGSPYSGVLELEVVSGLNKHDTPTVVEPARHKFDPTGLFK